MYDFYINIQDGKVAEKVAKNIQAGKRFLFSADEQSLTNNKRPSAGNQRLQIEERSSKKPGVKAIIPGEMIPLAGMDVCCNQANPGEFCAIVPDRDLYRSEEDTVNVLVVFPANARYKEILLRLDYHGEEQSSVDIAACLYKNAGVCLESFSSLLPGQYQLHLVVDGVFVDASAEFSVAEYQLAPFNANLVSYALAAANSLEFELSLSSYEIPWTEPVRIELLDSGVKQQELSLSANPVGNYQGSFSLPETGGPFCLRIVAKHDASRSCEIVIPGSSRAQRDNTLISELGAEHYFSLMPDAQSRPVRGGYLHVAEDRKLAIELNQVISDHAILKINQGVQAMNVLVWDLIENRWHEYQVGSQSAGAEYPIVKTSNMMMVFVGAWINNQAFEGFATVLSENEPYVELQCQDKLNPRDQLELTIRLKEPVEKPIPVYINIRDSRLSSTYLAHTSLAECLKSHIEYMGADYDDFALAPLSERSEFHPIFPHAVSKMRSRGLDHEGVFAAGMVEECDLLSLEDDLLPADENVRNQFPESLFCGLIYVKDAENICLKLGDALCQYSIDAFAYHDGAWSNSQRKFVVDQAVKAELDFPPEVFAGDQVYGRLHANTQSGKALINLFHNGYPVDIDVPPEIVTPFETAVLVQPGKYRLQVVDTISGESDQVEVDIVEPGKSKSYYSSLQFIKTGESLDLDSFENILSLKLIPALDGNFSKLVETTASYAHLCCEQTAAKILAASLMYLTAEDLKTQNEAEKIILAGVVRERKMITSQGFKMYPDADYHSEYYSRLAVQYLWQLRSLKEYSSLSDKLHHAIDEALELANQAAEFHKMHAQLDKLEDFSAAWFVCCEVGQHPLIDKLIANQIVWQGGVARLNQAVDPVYERTQLAYAAACLIKTGKLNQALPIANQILQDLQESGVLYSTVDSVALIALFTVLKSQDILQKKPKIKINGGVIPMSYGSDQIIETLEVLEGVALVEINRVVEHNWLESENSMPIEVQLNKTNQNHVGSEVNLTIRLSQAYVNGDIVQVSLPAALSRIQGGGRVKRFSMDFEGQSELTIPLLITATITEKQHFAVMVRNMFEENRVACSGLISI